MSVCIRCDDYPGTKPAEFYRHNRENFEKFDDVMQEATGDKKYLLGVIPDSTTDEDLKWLSTRNIVIGQHGTDHRESHQNQFDDYMTAADVVALIQPRRKRLQHLTGQPVNVYMPPHNCIDGKTLSALVSAGFRAFTSGPGSMFTKTLIDDNFLNCLHSAAPWWYGRSDEMLERQADVYINGTLQLHPRDEYLTLHFPWETNLDNGFSTLRELLTSIKDHVVDFQA